MKRKTKTKSQRRGVAEGRDHGRARRSGEAEGRDHGREEPIAML